MESMSSSSSFNNPQWIYDVFLNFRGVDTRSNFIHFLYDALKRSGINTFIDDQLQKGTELGPELLRAIEGSRIALLVVSENYGESSWCLDELVKVMECRRSNGQVVVPIFYDIDPSVIRHQSGAFGKALEALARRKYTGKKMIDVLSSWKTALTDAANLIGVELSNTKQRNLAADVEEIVAMVWNKLDDTLLSITDFPVGLDSRVQQVIKFIDTHSFNFCVIGIWGMGGSGKTTIAKAIYNQIHRKFVDKCFIENIREVAEKDGKGNTVLQQLLLLNILKTKVQILSVPMGTSTIEKRLSGRKALIVLDDVSKFDQLKDLCGNRKWIGQGSVIIITTRDVRLLNLFKVDHVYEMEEMNKDESLELFSWHAFRSASPREGFIELSRDVVAYCGGLPLALEVLGCHLYDRNELEWRGALSKLERIPNDQIQEKLRISFDGLRDDTLKDLFLDICCFFIGKDRAYVTDILNKCDRYADSGLPILVEKSLIKIEKKNKLAVHDLLRDMGREIVRNGSRRDDEPEKLSPEKRSRLWFHEDVLNVLRNDIGTDATEGLALKLHGTMRDSFKAKAFKEMRRLKLLQLDHVQVTGDYGHLSEILRWVYWKGFPLKYIPDKFHLENAVAIDFRYSNLQLVWKHPQYLEGLKTLNLSHSKHLKNTPDFSSLPNLENLILKDCPSLRELHKSIGDLRNLLLINLKGCTSLSNLPRVTYKLASVKTLIISGCSKIDKLEEDIVQMKSLTTLIADNTAVKQVPFSIVTSRSIGYISLCGFEGLARNVFPSLIQSWMSPTMNPLSHIHPFRDMQNNDMGNLVPMLSSFPKLRSVLLRFDSQIQLTKFLRDVCGVNCKLETSSYERQASKLSLSCYWIGIGCYQEVLNTLSKSISEELRTNESCDVLLPGDNYPYWLTRTNEGHSVFFEVPHDSRCSMKGMIFCVVYSSPPENATAECLVCVLIVNYTKCTVQIYKRDNVISFNGEDWQEVISNLGPGDKVEIFITFRQGLVVERTAAFLIYDESISMEQPSGSPDVLAIRDPKGSINVEQPSGSPSPDVPAIGNPEGCSQPDQGRHQPSPLKQKENAFTRFIKKIAFCKH